MFGFFNKKKDKIKEDGLKHWQIPMRNGLVDDSLKLMTRYKDYQKDNCENVVACLGFSGENPVFLDLATAPHVLIAGVPGSGKSVCINTIINSLLIKCSPADLKLFVIDPKKVDYDWMEKLPHTQMYADSVQEAENVLKTVHTIMNARFQRMKEHGCHDISEMPNKEARIVLIFDEFSTFMMYEGKKKLEPLYADIARLGRAAGVHLILATQKPSRENIPTYIRDVLPSRICFRVATSSSSRVALDQGGAEKLAGKGDGLYMNYDGSIERFQGLLLSEEQKKTLLDFWSCQDGTLKKNLELKNKMGLA